MKFFFTICLLSLSLSPLHAGPAVWVTETPLEFISAGKWSPGSAGQDLMVVDKATGLARVGERNGNDFIWSELPTGMNEITTATILRPVAGMDSLAVSSQTWNAIQITQPGATPVTLMPPVVGPQTLVRLSTGQLTGAVQEDLLVFSNLGNSGTGEIMGGISAAGTPLFQEPVEDLPLRAQVLTLSPQTSQPVLASMRAGLLRVDPLTRAAGIEVSGFNVTSTPADLRWTASPNATYSVPADTTTITQSNISFVQLAAGKTKPSGVSATYNYDLGNAISTLDTVPFADPGTPSLNCLLAVRFTATPDAISLYRLVPPSTAVLVETLSAAPNETMAAVVTMGNEFLVLSGPQGRVQNWQRYAQPAPGANPALVGSGSLPSQRPRAAKPNLFAFDLEPFVNDGAQLLTSTNDGDWTSVLGPTAAEKETDTGFLGGLTNAQSLSLPAGNFILGNQVLPTASTAGFGPVAGLVRPTVTFTPSPGGYAPLNPGASFEVTLTTSVATDEIYFRRPSDTSWQLYQAAAPPALTGNSTLLAISRNPTTNALSPLRSGSYTFAPLPPAIPAATVDSNSNGLSDAFERAFGLTDPNSDADGDGINNLTEQNAGTDPLDALSPAPAAPPELKLEFSQQAANDGLIHLAWPAGLAGIVLETSADMITWTPVVPQPVGNSYSDTPAQGRKFYRLDRP